MAERISNVPGALTFTGGRVPDGHTVPNPPRPAQPEAQPTRYQRAVLWLVLTIVALAVTIRALR